MFRTSCSQIVFALLVGVLIWGCADEPDAATSPDSGLVPPVNGCEPGQVMCANGFEALCSENGLWVETREQGDCGGREDSCADARTRKSYIGCEYWPVDLDNAVEIWPQPPEGGTCMIPTADPWVYRDDLPVCTDGRRHNGLCDYGQACPDGFMCQLAPACVLDAQRSDFAIVVSNPSNRTAATVTLTDAAGGTIEQQVAPGELAKLYPYRGGLSDQSLDGTGRGRAFRLTSTLPIVAYQFNPLDNVGVFSNDGSLLLPSHALGSEYFALTLPTLNRRPTAHAYTGYVTIVATNAGTTSIEVMPSTAIRAGEGQAELAARMPHRFELSQGEVLNLAAAGRGDLTGTRIAAPDNRTSFAVFVGHESTLIAERERIGTTEGLCCADHVEEQLFPEAAWGRTFAIARTEPRADLSRGGATAPDQLRILARQGDTLLTFNPEPIAGQCGRLVAGDYCDVYISRDTEITSNNPVLVGHMLLSTDGEIGDPALAFTVPVEQFRENYTFLVPDEYAVQYASIVARNNQPIDLNGVDISGQLDAFGTDFKSGRIQLQPGRQVLNCGEGCGLLVYGYDEAVSFMFAGGLDLEPVRAQ